MKTKPILKTASSKKSITRNVKMPKQKFEFVYYRHRFWDGFSLIVFGIPILILLGSVTFFFSEDNFAMRHTPILLILLFGLMRIMHFTILKSSGYAILHETYVELHLNKTMHLIRLHEISSVNLMGVRGGGGVLVISQKNKRKIEVGAYSFTFENHKRYHDSYLPIFEFYKALESRLEQISKPKA